MGMWTDDGALATLYAIELAFQSAPAILGPGITSWQIVLFKDDFTESRFNTLAGMIGKLATFTGYAPISTVGPFHYPPAEFAGQPRLIGDPVTFTKTVGAPHQIIYGWGIIGYAGGTPSILLLAKKLLDAHDFTDASPSISFFPIVGAYGLP